MNLLTSSQPTLFGDYPAVADAVRLFIIIVGTTLALVSGKIGFRRLLERDWESGLGAVSFALIVVVPAVGRLYAFGDPLPAITTLLYFVGLLVGVAAFGFRVTLRSAWWARRLAERRPPTR